MALSSPFYFPDESGPIALSMPLMNERVQKLRTPKDCEVFARNATKMGEHMLAREATRRAIALRAASYGATSDAERECLEAIYAYEEILFRKHGRRVRANRTRKVIRERGILAAIEHVVDRPDGTAGFTALEQVGLENFAFEAVILRHAQLFSESAVQRSRERMGQLSE